MRRFVYYGIGHALSSWERPRFRVVRVPKRRATPPDTQAVRVHFRSYAWSDKWKGRTMTWGDVRKLVASGDVMEAFEIQEWLNTGVPPMSSIDVGPDEGA